MSDSVRHHRQKPTRLLCPWDSPSKNTGVGCHFLLDHYTLYEIYKSTFIKRNGFLFRCILVFPVSIKISLSWFCCLLVFFKNRYFKILYFRIPGHHFVSCFELYHRIQDNFYKLICNLNPITCCDRFYFSRTNFWENEDSWYTQSWCKLLWSSLRHCHEPYLP